MDASAALVEPCANMGRNQNRKSMKVMLHTYNEAVNCENNYVRTFADYEDLLRHLVAIGDDGYETKKVTFL
jgi:hypothetical protein